MYGILSFPYISFKAYKEVKLFKVQSAIYFMNRDDNILIDLASL